MTSKHPIWKHKTFDEKSYHIYHEAYDTKANANKTAKRLRDEGYNARVVKHKFSDTHYVYLRQKGK
jgi:hypothetical protein